MYLQAVCKVAEGVRKIRLQLECHAVGGDCLQNVPGVLVDGCQVAVGVGEGRIDLDGPRVTLHGPVDILHLLEGVAHVAVGVCEVWVDADSLLVVTESLLESPLHLEDAG